MTGPSSERIRQDPVDRRDLLRRLRSLGLVGLATPLVAGCEILAARDESRYTIEMTGGHMFSPASLTIPVGSTVVWKNTSNRRHGITTDSSELEDAPIKLPDRVQPFSSPNLLTGESWALQFDHPGDYVYVCPYHYGQNMIGTITVEA